MGWHYRSTTTLPEPYDIVGCAWPLDEKPDDPGPWVRPCLVIQTKIELDEDGVEFGVVAVSYGSGEWTEEQQKRDLMIEKHEYRRLGLVKPTRFSMDRIEEFIWGTKWFPPHPYILNRGVYIGCLKEPQIKRLKECLKRWKESLGINTK
jgi:hypothetical protein